MQYIKASECYQKPLALWENHTYRKNTLITKQEQSLVCELIKRKKPKKILEVGVHSGGTTAAILNCIEMLNLDCKLYSVDLAENLKVGIHGFMHDEEIGFLVSKCYKPISQDKWKLYTGCTVAHIIEQIGNEIDFVVLDAAHILPGELLDFVTIFPYLTSNATVVLHDIYVGNADTETTNWIATATLFSSIVAEKYHLIDDINYPNVQVFANIGAFEIIPDTSKYIENLFQAMRMPWMAVSSESDILAYIAICKKHYPEKYYQNISVAYYEYCIRNSNDIHFNWDKINSIRDTTNGNIAIWGIRGMGITMHSKLRVNVEELHYKNRNSEIFKYLESCLKSMYFVDNSVENIPTFMFDFLKSKDFLQHDINLKGVIIGAQSEKSRGEILKELEKMNISKEKIHFIDEFII